MTTKRHLVMLAFMVLALGLSFTAGSVGSSASCDPTDCASACEIVSSADCAALCPPECIALCEELCADGNESGYGLNDCLIGTKASGTLAGIDPAGTLSFKLAAGQGAEINK